MPLTLDRIMELVRKHDAIGAKIAELDEQRAALEAERAAVKDELEGRKPGRRVPAPAERSVVKMPAAAKVGSTSSAPPSKPSRVEQELTELLPWLATIQSESSQKIVELRAGGKLPEAIAKELRLDQKAVANAIYRGRIQLRAARESGGKTKPAKTPASDSEDGPGGGEVLDELDVYNASTIAPVPAMVSSHEEEDDGEDLSDWSEFDAATGEEPAAPATVLGPTLVAVPELPKIHRVDAPSRTENHQTMRRALRAELGLGAYDELHLPIVRDTDAIARPKTRADCVDGPRPCPWAGCRHHLLLDVQSTGNLLLNFADADVDEIPETCSLDVADRGGIIPEETGALMNLTRERIRQYEVRIIEGAKDVLHEVDRPDDIDCESPMAALQRAS